MSDVACPAAQRGRAVRAKTVASRCALIVACAVGLASCGGSHSHSRAAAPKPSAHLDTPLRLLTCADWLRAGSAERATVIQQLHDFYGGPVASNGTVQGTGTVLSAAQADRLFRSYCSVPLARGFNLYKLYARAAAFGGQAP